jgi:hypothetical protein
MEYILPFKKWSQEDKKRVAELKKFVIRPEESYHISWALFNETQRLRKQLEEMECEKCWKKHHPSNRGNQYSRDKARLKKHLKEMERINKFFSPYHNRLGVDYERSYK